MSREIDKKTFRFVATGDEKLKKLAVEYRVRNGDTVEIPKRIVLDKSHHKTPISEIWRALVDEIRQAESIS